MRGCSDGHPGRPWVITHAGNKFITVRALDTTGLSPDQTVRVVSGIDVFPETAMIQAEIMRRQQHQQQQHQQQQQYQLQQPGEMARMGQGMGTSSLIPSINLNISPNFVTGGSGNSIDQRGGAEGMVEGSGGSNPQFDGMNLMVGGGGGGGSMGVGVGGGRSSSTSNGGMVFRNPATIGDSDTSSAAPSPSGGAITVVKKG